VAQIGRIFAQHATAGRYHLETAFVDGRWEWKVIALKRGLPEYTGTDASLEGAKNNAMQRIGLMQADWQNIGPAIDIG
jgi:phosphate-selective porin